MEPEEKEKDNKPVIPALKDTQRPQVKIKGLGSGTSLIERFKQFKKKDMAFILAGLGVLFMAPLAEHFLMNPSDQSGAFKEGWGFRGGEGFGKGGSPYEPGLTGLAPGSLVGGGGDVITPLNARDPSHLVMGPGATQQPPAASATPPLEKPKEEPDWKKTLKDAASSAGKEAVKRGGLPVPKIPLSSGGLRGLGAVSGGGGASFSLPAISASNVPNTAARGGHMARVRPATGYKGAASPRGQQSGSGGLEALKNAAAKAGSDFSRSGPASSALETAASRDLSGGAGAGGGEGKGADDKAASQSQSKDSKTAGESLEFMRLKEEQTKAIDLKWELKKKKAMLWPDLQQKMLEEGVMTPWKGLVKQATDAFGAIGANQSQEDKIACDGGTEFKRSQVINCTARDKDSADKPCWKVPPPNGKILAWGVELVNCNIKPGAAKEANQPSAEDLIRQQDEAKQRKAAADKKANEEAEIKLNVTGADCNVLRARYGEGMKVGAKLAWDPSTNDYVTPDSLASYGKQKEAAKNLALAGYMLNGAGDIANCAPGEAPKTGPQDNNVTWRLAESRARLEAISANIDEVYWNDRWASETVRDELEKQANSILKDGLGKKLTGDQDAEINTMFTTINTAVTAIEGLHPDKNKDVQLLLTNAYTAYGYLPAEATLEELGKNLNQTGAYIEEVKTDLANAKTGVVKSDHPGVKVFSDKVQEDLKRVGAVLEKKSIDYDQQTSALVLIKDAMKSQIPSTLAQTEYSIKGEFPKSPAGQPVYSVTDVKVPLAGSQNGLIDRVKEALPKNKVDEIKQKQGKDARQKELNKLTTGDENKALGELNPPQGVEGILGYKEGGYQADGRKTHITIVKEVYDQAGEIDKQIQSSLGISSKAKVKP